MEKARGKYLHFLYPGEYYISKFSLQYALIKAESRNFPNLLCFAFLQRALLESPVVKHVSFSKTFLGGERYPILTSSVLFLKESVVAVGSDSGRYRYLEGFDVITKIYLMKGSRVLCCRRVLTDYNFQKNTPRQFVRYALELLSIIRKRYGFFSLFHPGVIKEILEMLKYWFKGIKSYFMQAD